MAPGPETGYLVIADLTGYTAYLASGELEHAPAIAGDLLETIVGRLEPPLRLAKLEGDAAFLFLEDGRADGSLVLDAIEAAYHAFRRRLRSIERATTCDCASCRLAPRLDLKLFVHHGSYVRTSIAGRDELAGPSVIAVHRLLKGGSPGAVPIGYVRFTAAAVAAMGLDPEALALRAAQETYDHLGTIRTWTLDLEASWQAESAVRRLDIAAGRPILELELSVASDVATLWAFLTTPALRARWEGPIAISEASPGGRRGVGTIAQCVTGRLATVEEIVDWQPHDHVGWRLAVPGLGPVGLTVDLAAEPGGARLRATWASLGSGEIDPRRVARYRSQREAAGRRLAAVAAGSQPVAAGR
jgi:hypothetical protein